MTKICRIKCVLINCIYVLQIHIAYNIITCNYCSYSSCMCVYIISKHNCNTFVKTVVIHVVNYVATYIIHAVHNCNCFLIAMYISVLCKFVLTLFIYLHSYSIAFIDLLSLCNYVDMDCSLLWRI